MARVSAIAITLTTCMCLLTMGVLGSGSSDAESSGVPDPTEQPPVDDIPDDYVFGQLPLHGYNWWYAEWCTAYCDTYYTDTHAVIGTDYVLYMRAEWLVFRNSDGAEVTRVYADGTEGWEVAYKVKNPSGTIMTSGEFDYYDDVGDTYTTWPWNYPQYTMPASGPFGGWSVEFDWHIWSNSHIYDFTHHQQKTVYYSKPPAAPTNLVVTPSAYSCYLTWTLSLENMHGSLVTAYKIYRGTTPGGEGATPIATTGSQQYYTDSNLAPGVTFYYKVSAVNDKGESPKSSEAYATTIPEFGTLVLPIVGTVALIALIGRRKREGA